MRSSKLLLLVAVLAALSPSYSHQFTFYTFNGIEHIEFPDQPSAREYLQKSGNSAFANYTDAVSTTGWAFFHVITNGDFSDYDQAYSAGFLEGYLSRDYIYDAYLNFVGSVLNNNSDLSKKTYDHIHNQTVWLKNQCANITFEPAYWSVACTLLQQLWGLYDGYVAGIAEDDTTEKMLDFNHFYYLTNMGDLEDIVPAFNNTESYILKGRKPENMDCTIFVKLTDDDLVLSHNTHNIYSLMLRIYKTYEFHLQNPAVVAKTVSFSSRPGDLESKDDFYVTDSGIVAMETSFNTYNTSNYGFLHYDTTPVWLRAQVATRMATSASHWGSVFEKYRSGTHNSQWIIVDMKAYEAQSTLPASQLKDIVWMCEEYYYILEKFDVTQPLLVKQGYVAGYNVPYSQSIIGISNYTSTFTNDPRALIFSQYGNNVKNLQGAMDIIRLNNNGTGSVCSAIAPRCDALPNNAYDFGAIDGKATSSLLMKKNYTSIVSSPSFNDIIPPFNWQKFPGLPRNGMPDLYNFTWILYNFNRAQGTEEELLILVDLLS